MTNNYKQDQSGRSMVEMLGTLAVIGVLSVAGIAGYTTAMNKYKANEILNGASVRAMHISAKLQQNSEADITRALSEFTDNTVGGATFGDVAKEGTSQFKIAFASGKAPVSAVCDQMKAVVGTNANVNINTDCSILTYNNDLSAGVTVVPPCSLQASDCLSETLQSGACACAPATAGTACSKYNINECGVGYYCAFTRAMAGNPGTGTCTKISGETTTTGGYTVGGAMNWWSAYSFCLGLGNGHQLMRLSTVDTGLPDTTVRYCLFPCSRNYVSSTGYSGGSFTNEEKACKNKEGTTMTPDNTYASKCADLQTAIGTRSYWVQELINSRDGWYLNASVGYVNIGNLYDPNPYALCE